MRHRKSGRKLNLTSSHRRSLFANMANSLLVLGVIKTTLPKAKELRAYVEPLITVSKVDTVARRRNVFSKIQDRDIVTKLFSDLGPKYLERSGGYLRVIKCGFRSGDNAPMAYIEFVGREDI